MGYIDLVSNVLAITLCVGMMVAIARCGNEGEKVETENEDFWLP